MGRRPDPRTVVFAVFLVVMLLLVILDNHQGVFSNG